MPSSSMSRSKLVAMLKSQGYLEVRTAGGWLPLDKWWPYGQAGKNVMFYIGADGRVYEDHKQERPMPHWIHGVWDVRKERKEGEH